MTALVNTATFLFFALSLCVKSGYSYGTFVLLGAALCTLAHWWPKRSRHPGIHLIAWSFVLMGVLGIADAWFSGLSATYYNIPTRFLVMPLILYFLSVYPPQARAIWLGAACGAILGAISAHYYSYYAPEMLQIARASRYLNPIQFGNLATVLTVFAACGLRSRPPVWQRCVLVIGMAAGLYTTVLSETRGSLLALLLMLGLFALLRLRRRHLRPRNLAAAAALVCALAAVFTFSDNNIIGERWQAAQNDIALYQQGKAQTSVGLRLEMWRFAWYEGWRYPLWGPGTAQMRQDMRAWEQAHGTPQSISNFGHLHNEFLDAFARRGVLGLALVLFLFALPLYLYKQPGVASDAQATALRLAGLAHVFLYIGFGLTQAALYSHNSGFHFFALPLFMLYTAWQTQSTHGLTLAHQNYSSINNKKSISA